MTRFPRRSLSLATAFLGVGWALTAPSHAADSLMLRGNPQRTGVVEEQLAPPLSLAWQVTVSAQQNNPSSPVVVGDTVYFSSGNTSNGGGSVYALDAKTGAEKWRYPSQGGLGKDIFQSAPMFHEGNLYIGASNGNLYVLNAANGELVRTLKTSGPVTSSALMYDNILYFGTSDGTLMAIDPQTGNPAWRQTYRAVDMITSAPLIGDNMLFFTSGDQVLHAVSLATGTARWTFRMPALVPANSPVYTDNTLYVPSGNRLYAFQPRSGSTRWMVNLPNDVAVPPVAADGTVYTIDRDGKIYAMRSNNGKMVWAKPVELPRIAAAAPTISGDLIFVPSARSMVYAVSRSEGKIVWSYYLTPMSNQAKATPPTTAVFSAPLTIANGSLYAVSDDGTLSVFNTVAPDNTAPLTDSYYPQPGTAVSGQPPLVFAVKVSDPGSGLDEDSIQLTVDDQTLPFVYDDTRSLVYYQTSTAAGTVNPTLANGRHTVRVTARDWRGNVREESWSFMVDNSLPTVTNQQQQAPVAPTQPRTPRVRNRGNRGNQGNNPRGNQGNNQGFPGNRRGGNQNGGRQNFPPPPPGGPGMPMPGQ